MTPIDKLKSVLCGPDGKCCITGLDEDRAIVDCALQALSEQPQQEPVAHFGSAYVNANGVHVTTVLGPVAIQQDAKLYTTPQAPVQEHIYQLECAFGYSECQALEIAQKKRGWVGLTDEHGYLIDALKTIAEGTYDPWSEGAQAQRVAIAVVEKYEAAHGITRGNT